MLFFMVIGHAIAWYLNFWLKVGIFQVWYKKKVLYWMNLPKHMLWSKCIRTSQIFISHSKNFQLVFLPLLPGWCTWIVWYFLQILIKQNLEIFYLVWSKISQITRQHVEHLCPFDGQAQITILCWYGHWNILDNGKSSMTVVFHKVEIVETTCKAIGQLPDEENPIHKDSGNE